MMVNFGLPKLNIERYAFTEKEPDFVENFEFIKDRLSKAEQPVLEQIMKPIKEVAILHKPGYGKVVWRRILEAELNYLQIPFSKNSIVPVNFAGKTIRTYRLRHLIVEDKILLAITALQKGIDQIDVANMQSYLKALNLGIGVIVNFGKSKVHISGVRAPKN
jgi:GxxExxY protein